MPEIVIYLLKVNLALVLFYLGYHFLLRRLTFYTLNRYYLLFGFLFSAIYPLVNLREWFAGRQEVIYYVAPDWSAMTSEATSQSFDFWPYVLALFWAVVLFFLGRLALRLFSLWQIHRASVPARWQYFQFRHVIQRINPFSFWKNIYVHVEGHQEHELTEIFHHEQVHVEQLHTVDTLLAEFFSILCWFNPAVWLLRYAVRENLEFITDRRVLRSGVDKRAYQYSLLHLSGAVRVNAGVLPVGGSGFGSSLAAPEELVSHFNFKHLKMRIMMMNKKNSSALHLGKYLLAVPVVVLLALVLTVSRAVVNAAENELVAVGFVAEDLSASGMSVVGHSAFGYSVEGHSAFGHSAEALSTDTNVVRTRSRTLEWVKPLDGDTSIKVKTKVIVSIKDTLKMLDSGALRDSVLVLEGKKIIMGNPLRSGEQLEILADSILWNQKDNEVIVVRGKKIPDGSSDSNEILRRVETETGTKAILGDPVSVRVAFGYKKTNDDDPYVLIDGKKGDLNKVRPDAIESIEVIKGSVAVERYGAEAKNGVIKVTTKN